MTNSEKQQYIDARREYIESQFSHLNPKQREAVMATEGALLILAGAGSGKTTVLINRIANLMRFGRASDTDVLPAGASASDVEVLKKGGKQADLFAALEPVMPWRILAITFTNKAAEELKNRLQMMLGDAARDIWASTFHSCCVRILRRDAAKISYPDNFTIYDTTDSQSLIKQIMKDLNIDEKRFAPRAVLAEISKAKDQEIGGEEYLQAYRKMGDQWHATIGEIYIEYMKRLVSVGAMDFDDLIANTVKLLDANEESRRYWAGKFQYVMIDEYQDTNNLQYRLAALLSSEWHNICVVGDDDQSIYRFRGATIENILSFEDQHARCRTIRLEENYRSTTHILNAANSVISNNKGRKGKTLWTSKAGGELVQAYRGGNQEDEAHFIARKIVTSVNEGGCWKDHAILYRINAMSAGLERELKRYDIPYRIIGGTRFFDRAEVKDVLSYLNVIANPSDDLRLTRIINTPARGIGSKTIETVQRLSQENGCSMFDIVKNAAAYPDLQRSVQKLSLFAKIMISLQEFAGDHTALEILDQLLEKTGYVRVLEEKKTVEDQARAENVREIRSTMITYENESGDHSLEGYLSDVALYTDLDNFDQSADSVTLMTMHAAKGLEFPTVFVIGMEEGVFPSIRAIGEAEEIEEERRLCYVAMTRAEEHLYMTCAKRRMIFGQEQSHVESRFLDEIREEDIHKEGFQNNTFDGFGRSSENYDNYSYGYSYGRSNFGGGQSRYGSGYPSRKRKESVRPVGEVREDTSSEDLPEWDIGDRVEHKNFGEGVITDMRPMGNDCLVEIEFESAGRKKLMLRAAKRYTKKLTE